MAVRFSTAATARSCAARGHRTVVMSTDPAHSLADSLGVELGSDPTPVAENLWGQEIIAAAEMRRNWTRVSTWLTGLLLGQGVDRIRAEELTVPPGMDELFSLLQIKKHWDSEEFDVLIVDCAPSGETLRLLGFPEVAQWWVEKAFPFNKGLMGAAAPLARALDIPIPDQELMDEVDHLVKNLIAMDEISFVTGLEVRPVLAAEWDIEQVITRHLGDGQGVAATAGNGRPREIDLPPDTSPLADAKKGFFH